MEEKELGLAGNNGGRQGVLPPHIGSFQKPTKKIVKGQIRNHEKRRVGRSGDYFPTR